MNNEITVQICKALSDPVRLSIVQRLAGGELCACSLLEELEITQPTLSHHMKILCSSGLVVSQKDGKWCRYTLDCAAVDAFKEAVDSLQCCTGANTAAGCAVTKDAAECTKSRNGLAASR